MDFEFFDAVLHRHRLRSQRLRAEKLAKQEFHRILTLCDFIYLIPVPLGVSAYAKSGNVDIAGFHARAFAGGMFVADRWVYFAFILNWYAPEGDDPQTVQKFFAAIHEALTRVRDALS